MTTTWWHRRLAGVTLAAATLGMVAGCSAPAAGGGSAQHELDRLTVVTRPADDGTYRRAAFGPAWSDVDGNHCRQRSDALFWTLDRSQPYVVRQQGRCGHDVVAGTWTDPYTGRRMTFTNLHDPAQARAIPVDHRVSLASAWRYGASSWSDQKRLRFANDLENLQPTTERANSAKGGDDAASWRPRQAGQCEFASAYVATKKRYELPVDRSEKRALTEMLQHC